VTALDQTNASFIQNKSGLLAAQQLDHQGRGTPAHRPQNVSLEIRLSLKAAFQG
jgi:hypothetical protein